MKRENKIKSTVNDLDKYSMKYIYSTSQISKLSLTLHTFSITGSVAGLFLIVPVYYNIYVIVDVLCFTGDLLIDNRY